MNEQAVQFSGGLDTETSSLEKRPGWLIGVENYEPKVEGGYERTRGYERFDGRPRPSDASVVVIGCDGTWGASAVLGASIAGAISGATGVICYITSTLMGATKIVGEFQTGENITIGGTAVGIARLEPSVTQAVLNAMYNGAADRYRADIAAVTGSGSISGITVIGSTVYAFRNNAGGTRQECWASSPSGWTALTYPNPYMVGFSAGGGGTLEPGAYLVTQGANTAVAHRVMVRTGSFDDGTAEGVLVLRGAASPGAFTAGAASIAGLLSVTLETGTSIPYQAYNMAPSGRWVFKPYQFGFAGLASGTTPVYGVDRTAAGTGGNMVELDGFMAAPIQTSEQPTLYPERIEAHKDHLFIAIRNSLWFSGIGDPYSWSVFTGGGEVVIGQPITELLSIQGSEDQGALLVLCESKAQVVYGNSSADWKMVPLSREVGAKPYSAQQLGTTLAFDEQGVRDFTPTQAFGNFAFNTLTNHIKSKLRSKTVTASVVSKNLNRYRLFFSDGTFLVGTPGKRWSWTFGRYPFVVNVAVEAEIDGKSRIFMGGADGYVYEADVGRSFDGEPIEAWCKTAYAHLGAPGARKAFRRFDVDLVGDSAGTIKVQPDFSFGDTAIDQGIAARVSDVPVPPPASPWDIGQWDTGTWDGQYLSRVRCRLPGVGENVSLLFYSFSEEELSHTLQSVAMHYLPRKKTR